MSYKKPGKRDGTGPAKGSWMRKSGRKVGRRRQAGQKCPKSSKKGAKK